MSATGTTLVNNVRRLMQERAEPVIVEDIVRQTLMDTVLYVSSVIGLGTTWVTVFSTALATRDYTLPGAGVEYGSVLDLRYQSDQRKLIQRPPDWIELGRASVNSVTGRQYEYALTFGTGQEVGVMFSWFPTAVEVVEANVTVVPTDWPPGAGTVPTIPFSLKALKGTEMLTAAAIYDTLGDDRLVQLNLGPNFGKSMAARGMALVNEAMLDIVRLKQVHGVEMDSWFGLWWRT